VIIRPVHLDDHDQWLTLWEGYNAFYERVIPADVTALTWSRFFDAYEPMHAHVAEEGRDLVGLVHFLYHRNTAMRGSVCYLRDLFARADRRGAGIGRALIESVYRAAEAAGSPRVYWQTHETNRTAQRLYDAVAERSGFIVYRKAL